MKKLALMFSGVLIATTPQSGWTETLNSRDLVKKDGIYYKAFSDAPFNGKVKGRLNGRLKDGKKEGLFEIYYDNRLIKSRGYFNQGKHSDGLYESYRENGQLIIKGHYKNGRKDGFWIQPHRKEGGFWILYYDSGQLESKEHWKDAKLLKKVKVK
tara:strand:- start:1062 stop:1526 length:465 start_codon:yes stop_codon:yes gene_type:complete